MSGVARLLGRERHHMLQKPGRRLMHHVGLKFVKKKVTGGGSRGVTTALNLTPMIDYLLTVVIFLLMSFSASGEIPTSKNVTLPMAENTLDMVTAPMVAINGSQILVNEIPVGSTRAVEEAGRVVPRIEELFTALKTMKEDWKKINPSGKEFPGVVILQVDKEVPALVVKSVFQTAATAGYPNVSFMVGSLPKKAPLAAAAVNDENRRSSSRGAGFRRFCAGPHHPFRRLSC